MDARSERQSDGFSEEKVGKIGRLLPGIMARLGVPSKGKLRKGRAVSERHHWCREYREGSVWKREVRPGGGGVDGVRVRDRPDHG